MTSNVFCLPAQCIIINLAEDVSRKYDSHDPGRVETHAGVILSGPQGRFFAIDTAEQASLLGISFTPGARRRSLACRQASCATYTSRSRTFLAMVRATCGSS
jgi:hypothetical protein